MIGERELFKTSEFFWEGVNSAKGTKWVNELKEIWKLKRIRGIKRQMDVNEVNGLGLIIAVA